MGAPIGYTCPDIDKIVKKLNEQMKLVRRFNDFEDPKECERMLDWCFDVMEDAEIAFEDLRKSNDTLRKYGEEMEQEAETLQVQVSDLEDKIAQLEAEIAAHKQLTAA